MNNNRYSIKDVFLQLSKIEIYEFSGTDLISEIPKKVRKIVVTLELDLDLLCIKGRSSGKKMAIKLPDEIQSGVEEIRADNTSGAAELAGGATEILKLLVEKAEDSSPSQIIDHVTSTGKALIKAQPAMAPIFNLVNNVLLNIDELDELNDIKQTVRNTCREFIERLENSGHAIAKTVADLIQNGTVIMTHSYSSTVLKALTLAKSNSKNFKVICSESRPVCEGVTLARKLAEAGIDVTLVVDSTLFSLLPKTDIVVVGADSISENGLVNKIGTSDLAAAAQELEVGFYSLCGSEKFLPKDHPIKLNIQKDPREVLPEPIENVEVLNYYFDLTPLEYLTGVITEKGIFTPNELRQKLEGFEVHSILFDSI